MHSKYHSDDRIQERTFGRVGNALYVFACKSKKRNIKENDI